jgi:1A family penicillin-binding protein
LLIQLRLKRRLFSTENNTFLPKPNYHMPMPQLSKSYRSEEQKTQKSHLSLKKILFLRLIKLFAFIFFFLAVSGIAAIFILSKGLPDPNKLIQRDVAQSTKIYDRTGQTVIFEIFGDEKRTLVDLDALPDYVKQATIAIEDKDFYKHQGFSIFAIARTVVTNLIFHKKAGGSTLTQQFIKNAVLTSEKTYTRKAKELILAYQAEKKFTKNQILQMYLNEIPYGSNAYGIEAASQKYFGKSAKDISLSEAAILAAMTQAPSRYSPYGPNRDLLINRQKIVLGLMVEQDYITKEQSEVAKAAPLVFSEQKSNIIAPHFVMYVKELLSDKYGEKLVEQGGLKIITTLDLYKQRAAEEAINKHAQANKTKFNSNNAALVAFDPKNGQILAMVGSKDYFSSSSPEGCTSGRDCAFEPNDNVTLRSRQPGSSLKPLVYAAAFIKGYTPNTILYDVMTNFSNDPSRAYEPKNYNLAEHGPVSMKKALAGSLNIPAVKTLYLAGIDNVSKLAKDLNYSTLDNSDRFGLSLVLGGGEVRLIEHANAYSAFAREGELSPASSILKVIDKDGKVLEEFKENKKTALDAEVAREINEILSDNAARSYIFGEKNWLTLGSRPVAAKTGTTNDYKDAWTIGYTPSLVAGVWVGNNDNSSMKKGADGSVVAAPIWHDFMNNVLGNTPVENFRKPALIKTGKPVLDGGNAGEKKIKIDRASGLLATELTPPSYIEEKTFSETHCILYYVIKDDPRGEYPKNPAVDPQFDLWEKAVQKWASTKGVSSSSPPLEFDNLHTKENLPILEIINPADGQEIIDPTLYVSINITAARGVAKTEYFLDDKRLGETNSYPYNFSGSLSFVPNGIHELRVVGCDDIDNCATKIININLRLPDSANPESLSIIWNTPMDGEIIESNKFPIRLESSLGGGGLAEKILFFYKPITEPKTVLIGEASVIVNGKASTVWVTSPPPGNYQLYIEAQRWNGESVYSGNINITVL